MNRVILSLTIRQLLGRRRTLLLVAFAFLPVLVAIIYRLAGDSDIDPQRFVARAVLDQLAVTAVLPFVALVMGTAALGSDIEDGTAVYLFARPIPRSTIILSKLLPAWIVSATVTAASVLLASVIGLWGEPMANLPVAFAVATILGSLLYCAVFLALSIYTGRALIIGLIYVFVWEGLLTNLLPGTRLFSVREYTRAIADVMSSTSAREWQARLDGPEALVLMVIVGVLAVFLAIRRLERWEIGETG